MRIAIFSDTFAPEINGVARSLKRFTNYLDKKEISYQVFAPEMGSEVPHLPQIYRFRSIPFLLYPQSRIALPSPFKFNKAIREFNPTIIHVATPFNIGLTGKNYGKKNNIPMVASYHTNFDEYLSFYNLELLNKWLWNYMKWFHRPFEKVFVPSESTREKLISERIHSNIEIWSRGVDHNLYSPLKHSSIYSSKYGIKENNIILYVGRIAPEKDIELVIKTFNSLPLSVKEDSHLVIAGDGPLYNDLSSQYNSDQITFTGFIQGEELATLYASANIFLFPSSTETFGNVVLESLSSGLPVIGANAGGVKELIQDKKTGILCTPRHLDDFVEAVTYLLDNPNKLKYMGEEARKFALTQSWDEIFDKLLLQYEEVLLTADIKNKILNIA